MGASSSPLYARPSFLFGAASILDFGGVLTEYNYSNNGDQADFLALRADWFSVGNDMRAVLRALEDERAANAQEKETRAAD